MRYAYLWREINQEIIGGPLRFLWQKVMGRLCLKGLMGIRQIELQYDKEFKPEEDDGGLITLAWAKDHDSINR